MELEAIKIDLNILQNKLATKITKLDCYLFGSILTNVKQANDIDILIIYEGQEILDIVKKEFIALSSDNPFHINYFTFAEEKELNFIKQQKAEKIFGL